MFWKLGGRKEKCRNDPLFLILGPFSLSSQNDAYAFYIIAHLNESTGLIFPQLLTNSNKVLNLEPSNSLTRIGQQFSLIYPKTISEETNVPHDTFF